MSYMLKDRRCKIVRKCIVVVILLLYVGTITSVAYAVNEEECLVINEKLQKEDYQIQIDRYTTDGDKVAGLCNICALMNLLNRKWAMEGEYSESNCFDVEYVTRVSCYEYDKNGLSAEAAKTMMCEYIASKECVICDYDTDGYLMNPIYTIGEKNYQAVLAEKEENTEEQIAKFLDEHKEGVFVRVIYEQNNKYDIKKGHCIIVTSYEMDERGDYIFYVIDTGSKKFKIDEKLSDSWVGKEYKKINQEEMRLNQKTVDKIIYLESVETPSPIIFERDEQSHFTEIETNQVPSLINKLERENILTKEILKNLVCLLTLLFPIVRRLS